MQADSVEEPKYRGMMDCARYYQICIIDLDILQFNFLQNSRGRQEVTRFM